MIKDWRTAEPMPLYLSTYVILSKRLAMLKRVGAPKEDQITTLTLMNLHYGKFGKS